MGPVDQDRELDKVNKMTRRSARPIYCAIGDKITVFDCVIGRWRLTIQPSSSSLAQNFILKPNTDNAVLPCTKYL